MSEMRNNLDIDPLDDGRVLWSKTGEKDRAAWWMKFCTGQISGLVPVSVTK